MIHSMAKFSIVLLISLGTLFFGSGSLAGITPSTSRLEMEKTIEKSSADILASRAIRTWNPETAPASSMETKEDREWKERSQNPFLILVNKENGIPMDYRPEDLVEPQIPFSFSGESPKKLLRKEAANALEKLFAEAKEEGIDLVAVSGYRSFETQQSIYEYNVQEQGQQGADQVSAKPGHSEHQTGLAMDISSRSMGLVLEQEFGNTPEGKWLAANAPRFGYIVRYPLEKEDITGYSYEPWHIRYVGLEAALFISEKGMTLENYMDEIKKVQVHKQIAKK